MIGFMNSHWVLRVPVMSLLLVWASPSVAQQGPPKMYPEDGFLCYKARASRGEVPIPPGERAVLIAAAGNLRSQSEVVTLCTLFDETRGHD